MNAVKVKPVSRQELLKLLVTDADAFTAQRYLRHREVVPSLPELEDQGKQVLPGPEGVLADLYYSLWAPGPGVKEESEVAPARKYWRGMLGETVKSSAYQELHSQTELKELQSVLGTIAMGETILKLVPEEDQEKLQELAGAQGEADDLQSQAQEAQAQAQTMQALAETTAQQAEGQPQPGQQGQPGPGQATPPQNDAGAAGMTPEQAKALANELARQVAEAKAKAETLQKQAQEAKAKAEQMAEALMGKPDSQEAADKLQELTRIGLAAVKQAAKKVEEVSETIEGWGLDPAELFRQGLPEAMALLERMRRNETFKRFANLLGRIRKIAARKARSKIAGEGVKIAVQETGRDLKRAVPAELVALVNPALQAKALKHWARGELRLRGQQTKQRLGHGPVVVCEDASGSMEGAKQKWAKAVVLSLAHYAKLQKRSFAWVLFDARVQKSKKYPQGKLTAEQMLELVESRAGGGTDFEKPLRAALEMIRKDGLSRADICFITDGECEVSDEFLQEFKAAKKALEINVITVLCDVGSVTDSAVNEFSDRVEKASAFTAEEAEAKIIRHL